MDNEKQENNPTPPVSKTPYSKEPDFMPQNQQAKSRRQIPARLDGEALAANDPADHGE